MAVLHQTGSGALSAQERRELTETAQVFEMIVEANPLEVGALEALREIYVKLGDADKHADVVRRIEAAHGGPVETPRAVGTPEAPPPTAATPRAARAEPERPAPRRGGRRIPADSAPPPCPCPRPWTRWRPRRRCPCRTPSPPPRPAGRRPTPRARGTMGPPRPAQRRATSAWCTGWASWAICSWPPASSPRSSSPRPSRAARHQREDRHRPRPARPPPGGAAHRLPLQAVWAPGHHAVPARCGSRGRGALSSQMARKYEVLPIKRTENSLTLAMADPTNVFALDDVAFMTGLTVVPVVASQGGHSPGHRAAVRGRDRWPRRRALGDGRGRGRRRGRGGRGGAVGQGRLFELKESADEAPVVRLVNMILVDAIRTRRLRHPPRALREGLPGALPHRRRAARDHDPAQAAGGGAHRRA